jgi:hypothetical protein
MVMGAFWGYGFGYKTTSGVCFGFWFLEIRQGVLFLVLEVQSSLFQDFSNHPPIKVWKKSQPLQQHMNNYHKIRKNACQKERLSTQLKNSSSFFVPFTIITMIGYVGLNLISKGATKLGCCCKA